MNFTQTEGVMAKTIATEVSDIVILLFFIFCFCVICLYTHNALKTVTETPLLYPLWVFVNLGSDV